MDGRPDDSKRIQRVEEEVAFTGHGLDTLSEQMLALNQKLEAMAARIEKLEFRLERALAGRDEPNESDEEEGTQASSE